MIDTARPLKVFIVENDDETSKYLRIFLEDLGHQVFAARTLADALVAIPKTCCNVLISDIGLEDGTGWDLLLRLRAEHPAFKTYPIAISGFGRNADRLTSEAAGFRHHLLKPFDLDELEGILAQARHEQA